MDDGVISMSRLISYSFAGAVPKSAPRYLTHLVSDRSLACAQQPGLRPQASAYSHLSPRDRFFAEMEDALPGSVLAHEGKVAVQEAIAQARLQDVPSFFATEDPGVDYVLDVASEHVHRDLATLVSPGDAAMEDIACLAEGAAFYSGRELSLSQRYVERVLAEMGSPPLGHPARAVCTLHYHQDPSPTDWLAFDVLGSYRAEWMHDHHVYLGEGHYDQALRFLSPSAYRALHRVALQDALGPQAPCLGRYYQVWSDAPATRMEINNARRLGKRFIGFALRYQYLGDTSGVHHPALINMHEFGHEDADALIATISPHLFQWNGHLGSLALDVLSSAALCASVDDFPELGTLLDSDYFSGDLADEKFVSGGEGAMWVALMANMANDVNVQEHVPARRAVFDAWSQVPDLPGIPAKLMNEFRAWCAWTLGRM